MPRRVLLFVLRWLQRALFVAGAGCFAWVFVSWQDATLLPWQQGNASFAGHRDSFFRAFRDIRVADQIEMATTRGTFRYRATRMRIVNPGDLSVLEPLDGTALTLITCYPFSCLGDAP